MKKFNKKAISLLLAILLVMAVVPTSFAGEGTPRMTVETTSDYYKKGETVTATIRIYDADVYNAAFCLGFDSEVVQLVNEKSTGKDRAIIIPNLYDEDEGTGVFTKISTVLSNENELVRGSWYVNVSATELAEDIDAVDATVERGEELADGTANTMVKVGANGITLARISFVMIEDGTPNFTFKGIEGDTEFGDSDGAIIGNDKKVNAVFAPEETPYADAVMRAAEVYVMIDELTERFDGETFDDIDARIDATEAAYNGMSELEKKVFEENHGLTANGVADKIEREKEKVVDAREYEIIEPVYDQVYDLIDTGKYTDADELEQKIEDAENAMGELTPERQARVREEFRILDYNYDTIISAAKAKVEELREPEKVDALIEAIGEVTLAKEEAIEEARAAYEALNDGQKALVKKLETLKDAEKALAELYDAIEDVEALIDALPEEVKPEDAEAVVAARNAYKALTAEQQALVENIAVLDAAEVAIADYVAAAEVDAKIEALGEVGLEDKAEVEAVRAAYEALTPSQKAKVTKFDELKAAEDAIAKIEEDMAAAKAVDEKIEAIGEVTLEKEEAIEAARDAYDGLNDDQKALVEGFEVLAAAEAKLDELKEAKAAADEVDALIEAIGEVTLEDEEAIREAEGAYYALSDAAKGFVTKFATLEEAKVKLADLKAAKEVIDMIDALPEEITPEDTEAVVAARNAYKALTAEQQALVTNITKLEAAEDVLDDYIAAKVAEDAIDAIPATVALSDKATVEAARSAYEALTDAQKALVPNFTKLEAAEVAIDKIIADNAEADEVDALIEAIGEVTLAKEEAIKAARDAYEGLTDDQKALVEKYEVLDAAEKALAELKAEIEAVIDMIDALPEEVKPEDTEAVVAAKAAYNALTAEQKEAVTNIEKLTAAEEAIADYVAAAEVDAKIEALGEVGLEDKAEVEAVRAAYEALTDSQKAKVTKFDELKAAEDAIAKIEEDMAAAKAVDEKIEAIGEVTLAKEEAIKAARDAYEGLTDDQKALVEGFEVLTSAEAKLAELKAEIEAVIEMIDALPEEVKPEDTDAVIAAREAYDALTEDQQALVENIAVLEAAEAVLADYIAAKEVEDLIAAVGDEATFAAEDALVAAKAAYATLTDAQKALVPNADKLEELVAELEGKKAIVDDYLELYGDSTLIIEDNTGYLDIKTTLEDLLTAEDKDAIVDGQVIVYTVVGESVELEEEADISEYGALEGEKPFMTGYMVVVGRSIADIGDDELIIGEPEYVYGIPGTITVEFTVPEDMLLSSDQTTRTFSGFCGFGDDYVVARVNDIDDNANTLTFVVTGSADLLPTYIDTANPVTGDSIAIYVVMFMFLIMTAVVIDRKRAASK